MMRLIVKHNLIMGGHKFKEGDRYDCYQDVMKTIVYVMVGSDKQQIFFSKYDGSVDIIKVSDKI